MCGSKQKSEGQGLAHPPCRISKIAISAVGFFLIAGAGLNLVVGQEQPPTGVTFSVVSVTVLSDKEASARTPDYFGQNVAVRLRLSCTERGFYFFTLKGAWIPVGYALKLGDGGTVWLAGRSGAEKTSPGLRQLTLGMPGSWLLAPAGARPAIEWEENDSTYSAGEKHARTIFLKFSEKDKPVEVISESYVVPAGPPPVK